MLNRELPVRLAVDWDDGRGSFFGNLKAALARVPRTLDSPVALRVDWIRGRVPAWALSASLVWHALFVGILLLPIWQRLNVAPADVAPLHIELTWSLPTDIPPIVRPKHVIPPKAPDEASEMPPPAAPNIQESARPTVPIPEHLSHPHQKSVQSEVPAPPTVAPQIANIPVWQTQTDMEIPRLQFAAAAVPTHRTEKQQAINAPDIQSPEIQGNEKNSSPLNIAPVDDFRPALPLNARVAPTMRQRNVAAQAAPQNLGPTPSNDPGLKNLMTISAGPSPPAPIRPATSTKPAGLPESAAARANLSQPGSGASTASAIKGSPPGPAISKGSSASTSGPMRLGRPRAKSIAVDPTLPPEAILGGKRIYTLHVNLPNFTSASGSWVMSFAELNEKPAAPGMPIVQVPLAAPQPLKKVDPKYPPSAIDDRVEGEVVLYAIIRKDGSVDNIGVIRSLDPRLDQNAVEALSQWKFQPAEKSGEPVDVEAVVHIPFRLSKNF